MVRRFRTVFLIVISVLAGGCAHTWSPKEAPPIPMESVGMLGPNLSVEFINAQPLTTPQLFGDVGGHTHYANYNEWTEFFIKYWSEALTKRGASVGPQSSNKINVKLNDFMFMQGFSKVRVNIKIHLSSPDNTWKKTYEETDTSGWSIGRAFGSVVYHSVEKLLVDPDVMGRMKQ